jgi:DNA mismatch repair protein MSH3
MHEVAAFPKQVIIALAQCIEYLSAFRVADALLATNFFAKFASRAHMLLNANTLTNLCVLGFLPLYHSRELKL